jgi:hypothetical protein
MRPAGLVEMHVHVDQAGQNQQPAGIDFVRGTGELGTDLRDPPILDRHVRGRRSAGEYNGSAADDQIRHR